MKPLLIQSLQGQELSRPPVWCMRQAGRYLPEYQELKKRYSFNQLAETPDLAREVTLQPLKRFSDLDAAILFADILTPSRALGFDFEFSPGPVLKNALKTPDDVFELEYIPVKDSVPFVFESMAQVRHALEEEEQTQKREVRRAALGFAASPWTLACYLIDQGIYKQHMGTKVFSRKYPDATKHLLNLLTDLAIEYLTSKHEAGADAVQLFDTWGNLLSPEEYEEWSGQWIGKIVSALEAKDIPVIVYISGGTQHIQSIVSKKPSVISVDWRCSLAEAESLVPETMGLQGNIDPTILFSDTKIILDETHKTLSSLKRRSRFIANLGHGMIPATPISGMEAFLAAVHSSWR